MPHSSLYVAVYKKENADLITDHLKFDVMIDTFIPKDMDKKRVEKFNIAEAKATKETMEYIYDNTKVRGDEREKMGVGEEGGLVNKLNNLQYYCRNISEYLKYY